MAIQAETVAAAPLVGGGVTNLHSHAGNAPSGTVVLLSTDESETAGGSTEQTKTYALAANTYSRILVEFDWEMIGAANTMYEWTLAVEIPQATVIHDANLRSDATGTGDIFKQAGLSRGSAVKQTSGTLRVRMTPVTAGGATARILSMRVYGILA
jgi:hypothetical protein